MSITAPPSAPSPGETVAAAPGPPPAPPSALTRSRRIATWVGVLLVGGVMLGLLTAGSGSEQGDLDPEGTGSGGTMALAEVLRAHGVRVDVVRAAKDLDAAVDGSTTLVVGNPAYLGSAAAQHLGTITPRAGRVVVLVPETSVLAALTVPVDVYPGGAADPVAASCTDPAVRAGDRVAEVELRMLPRDGLRATACFPVTDPSGEDHTAPGGHGYGLVRVPAAAGRPQTDLVGFPGAFTNRYITESADAGVAVRLLGPTPKVVWYHPDIADLGVSGTSGEIDPWPTWQGPAAALLAFAFVIFAIATGRRLGRLVPEPLPVVVRAVETTEARARLYRRDHDRARAAAVLRHATLARLRRRLGVDAAAHDPAVINLAATVAGMPPVEVAAILAGPAPADDPELQHLARQLHDLEERARHP